MAILHLLSKLTNHLFPRHCDVCSQRLSGHSFLCESCQLNLSRNHHACRRCALPLPSSLTTTEEFCGPCSVKPPVFIRCIAPFRYEPPISTWIIQLKFQHRLRYAKILSQLLTPTVRGLPQLPQCIIPVPLHSQRLRRRGFNQAIEIAKPLSKALRIPILYNAIYRQKATLPQSQLSASARRRNIAGAFACRQKIHFQHVAVIDDVMTTGQTVTALSHLLQQQGVKTIEIWCCARAV